MLDLGIDIGGTFIKYAIVDDENQIVRKWKKETIKHKNKDQFYEYLCSDLPLENIRYIGVSAPGVLAMDSTILSKAAENVCIMYQTNVRDEIHKRTHKAVHVLNDAKSAGFCEMQIGNGKGTASSVYFVIGTGIGGCVCDDSHVVEGVNRIAGEFSNLPIGFKEDGSIQFLYEIASMSALISIYNRYADQPVQYGTEITEKYHAGDPMAIKAFDEWCRNICAGLFQIIIFYNPEVICIGGGISQEEWFIEKLRSMIQSEIKLPFQGLFSTRIESCRFSNDANLLGAILFARQKEMEN
ncbi:ROK family protein [Dubosiella newyorkensis]|jgi:predicted NBD/HSP70 family sugar kinase|uniref:Sugar kinase n=3 Tax=Dubosiella newyorkensis TaxID=1862672 RepID=A0A1U7NLI4_9FIRM|nr:ROK family protein [Dubosiella newyorkensis]MCI9040528.1 ROK family protein [Dubosiella newyorkensis]OLU45589.1 sugar kinase [Dubosiella newyorkensis]